MGIRLNYRFDLIEPEVALAALADIDRLSLAEEIGELLLEETLYNFDQQQAPDGTLWEPSQRAIEEGGKTLTDFGHLRDSVAYNADSNGVEIGSAMEYAAIHQFGGKAGRNQSVEIEARPYLGFTDDIKNEIGDIALGYFERAIDAGARS